MRLRAAAADLIGRARQDGWHHPILDTVVDVIEARTGQVLQPDAAVWCHSTAL